MFDILVCQYLWLPLNLPLLSLPHVLEDLEKWVIVLTLLVFAKDKVCANIKPLGQSLGDSEHGVIILMMLSSIYLLHLNQVRSCGS